MSHPFRQVQKHYILYMYSFSIYYSHFWKLNISFIYFKLLPYQMPKIQAARRPVSSLNFSFKWDLQLKRLPDCEIISVAKGNEGCLFQTSECRRKPGNLQQGLWSFYHFYLHKTSTSPCFRGNVRTVTCHEVLLRCKVSEITIPLHQCFLLIKQNTKLCSNNSVTAEWPQELLGVLWV